MTDHLARHQLEQLVAEDPEARIRPVLRVHVAACDLCTMRLRALHAAKAQFLASHPAADFARDALERAEQSMPNREPPRWVPQLAAAGLILVVACIAAAFLWYGHESATNWARETGGVSFKVLAKRGAQVSRLRDGDVLTAGDQLAFEYSLDRPRHLLLFGIDETGTVRRYFPEPEGPEVDTLLATAARATLPTQIQLDARAGDERLYALFSEEPIGEMEARTALLRAVGEAWASGSRLAKTPELQLRARAISVWFRKR
jgi:hypothetical protein